MLRYTAFTVVSGANDLQRLAINFYSFAMLHLHVFIDVDYFSPNQKSSENF